MTYDPAQDAAETAKEAIDKMFKEVEAVRRELALLKADIGCGFQALEPYPWKGAKQPKQYKSPEAAKTALTELFEQSRTVAERNAAVATHNKKLLDAAVAYITALGVPATYKKSVSSRSYKTKSVDAEWMEALYASARTSSGWCAVERQYDDSMKQIAAWREEGERVRRHAEIQQAAVKRQEDYIKTAAAMAGRYGLEVTAAPDDVFDKIIESDKYLYLAYFLMRNRGDWNDGSMYAEVGLERFTVEDDRDRQVAAEIGRLITEWDGDGRCFRDCHWNYDRLFEIAAERNTQAVADHRALSALRGHDA